METPKRSEWYMDAEERARMLAWIEQPDDTAEDYDDYVRAACALSEEIDRLEDLRRWRPMTEAPGGGVTLTICRHKEIGSFTLASYNRAKSEWYYPAGAHFKWEWTYIPGLEPGA